MKAASVQHLRDELKHLPANKLVDICMRLAKYKIENKELLHYLLLESEDEQSYIQEVKNEISAAFENVNSTNLYFAKKTIRKILRIANKHIRYIGTKQAEVELLICFCKALQQSAIPIEKSTALNNLYLAQLKKAAKAIEGMHHDLQYDYKRELNKLT